MTKTTEEQTEKVIFNLLKQGAEFGTVMDMLHPYFSVALNMDDKNLYWHHYGSSANRPTLEDLHFVLDKIFDISPTEFMKKYIYMTPDQEYKFENIATSAEHERLDKVNKGLTEREYTWEY